MYQIVQNLILYILYMMVISSEYKVASLNGQIDVAGSEYKVVSQGTNCEERKSYIMINSAYGEVLREGGYGGKSIKGRNGVHLITKIEEKEDKATTMKEKEWSIAIRGIVEGIGEKSTPRIWEYDTGWIKNDVSLSDLKQATLTESQFWKPCRMRISEKIRYSESVGCKDLPMSLGIIFRNLCYVGNLNLKRCVHQMNWNPPELMLAMLEQFGFFGLSFPLIREKSMFLWGLFYTRCRKLRENRIDCSKITASNHSVIKKIRNTCWKSNINDCLLSGKGPAESSGAWIRSIQCMEEQQREDWSTAGPGILPTNNQVGLGDVGVASETGRDIKNLDNYTKVVWGDFRNVYTHVNDARSKKIFLEKKTGKIIYYNFGSNLRLLYDDCFNFRLLPWNFRDKNRDDWCTATVAMLFHYFYNDEKHNIQLRKQTKSHQIIWESSKMLSVEDNYKYGAPQLREIEHCMFSMSTGGTRDGMGGFIVTQT